LNPDVIHAHSLFFFTSLVAACLRPLLGKPLVTTIHSGPVDCLSGTARLAATVYQRIIGRFVLTASDRVIAVSEAVADHATRLGCPPHRISVIPNGVELGKFGSAPPVRGDGRSRVVVVGRLIPNKGPQYLVDAAPAILARHPRTEFVFVGDGPLRNVLQSMIERRSLTSAFTFLGLRDDVPAILRGASMLVLPSLSEGMPLTVLEAMASGLPVVATTVGGTKEVVRHGTTGFLVKPGCPEELEKAICCVLANPGRARTMGLKGRRVVERDHDWGQVADRTLELYEKIIASSREEVAGPLGAKLSA
jgi:glycosyltransferase involved in cell wall biosynthesis